VTLTPGYRMSPDEARRLRLLIDSIPAMVGYWDHDLRTVVANVAFAEFVGMAPAEIQGRHFGEVIGENRARLDPGDLDAVLAGERRLSECALIDRHGATRHFQTVYVPDVVDGEVAGFYLQATDLTSHVEEERSREEALRMFQTCVENAPIGQAITDTSLRCMYVNPSFCSMFHCTADEAINANVREFVSPDDLEVAEADFDALTNAPNSHVATELRIVRRDGSAIWVQRNAVMVPGEHGGDDILIGQFQDITARRLAESELARLAVTDPLTGLFNRKALADSIRRHSDTEPSASVGIVFLDLDGFKQVNDDHGHAVGDTLLAQVAARIAQNVAAPDSVYRLGGDEFVVLSTTAASEADVTELTDRLCNAVRGSYDGGGTPLTLGVSAGSTWGPVDDLDELLRHADAQMYRHKKHRRGRDPAADSPDSVPGARADRIGQRGEATGM
jgi:diguanylate cyclase (GGDEF)-like protein/PAS domain S-box-containing protein